MSESGNNFGVFERKYRLLWVALAFCLVVYIKDDTWAWFGSTIYWIIVFSLIILCAVLWILFFIELYDWGSKGFSLSNRLWILFAVFCLLLLSLDGMK